MKYILIYGCVAQGMLAKPQDRSMLPRAPKSGINLGSFSPKMYSQGVESQNPMTYIYRNVR